MNTFRSLVYFCCAAIITASAAQAGTVLKNGELLEKSGIADQITQIPAALQQSISEVQRDGAPVDAKFAKAWHNVVPIAFNTEKILASLDRGLEKLLTAEEKSELLALYNSPEGRKIVAAERLAARPEAMGEIAALAQNPASFADRAALYKELDDTIGATPAMINLVTDMAVAMQAGIQAAAMGPGKTDVDALKAEQKKALAVMTQQMEAQVAATFAYSYKTLSADELKAYIKANKTPTGQKFNRGVIDLMSSAFTAQTRELGELLYKALETGQPG